MIRTASLLVLAVALSLAATTLAAPGEDDTVPGELQVNTNSEWVKAVVNGQEWDSVEYENRGRRMMIMGIDRGPAMINVELIPTDETLAPVKLGIPSKAFKRRVHKRILYYTAKRNVKFKKRADAKPPAPEPAPEPDKTPPKVVPTPDPDEL